MVDGASEWHSFRRVIFSVMKPIDIVVLVITVIESLPDYDVIICGLGPVGQMLALLLGNRGVRTLVVDRQQEPWSLPRAATIDDEVLRILQAVGLDSAVLADAQPLNGASVITASGQPVEIYRALTSALGQRPFVAIHQPMMERTLLAALESRPTVDVRRGLALKALDRRADAVEVFLHSTAGGASERVCARWLVGCDGASSAVRARLEVPFEGRTAASYLTFNERHHELILIEDRANRGYEHLALEVADGCVLESAARRLTAAGGTLLGGIYDGEPGIDRALKVRSPAGHVYKLFCGMQTLEAPAPGDRPVRPPTGRWRRARSSSGAAHRQRAFCSRAFRSPQRTRAARPGRCGLTARCRAPERLARAHSPRQPWPRA